MPSSTLPSAGPHGTLPSPPTRPRPLAPPAPHPSPTALALALLLCACGGGGGPDAKDAAAACQGSACAPPGGKPDGGEGGTTSGNRPSGSDAGTDAAMAKAPLEAQLQVNGGVGLPCGECAVLIAQANGGEEPYTYAWSDDSLEGPGPHRVCPDESTEYTVKVTDDSAVDSPEFQQDAMVVEAKGKLECSDAPEAWGGCFPSPEPPDDPEAADAPVECAWMKNDPFLVETLGLPEEVATAFGSPAPTGDEGFVPGKTYEVSYDQLLLILTVDEPVHVDIWGGDDPCDKGQKLGELTLDGRWHQSFCFEAEKAWPYVRIDIDSGDTLAYLDLVPPVATVCKGCSKED